MLVATGTYTGNATANRDVEVGFKPKVAIIVSPSGSYTFLRIDTMAPGTTGSRRFIDGTFVDAIRRFTPTGFQLGATSGNVASSIYFWLALGDNGQGDIETGTHSGDDADGREIPCSFKPDFVHVHRSSNSTTFSTFTTRQMQEDIAADTSIGYGVGAVPATDRIQRLFFHGFELGTNIQVNASGSTYHWFALRETKQCEVGLFTGNASARTISTERVKPSFVLVRNLDGGAGIIAVGAVVGRTGDFLPNNSADGTRITLDDTLTSKSFDVDNSIAVNGSGDNVVWLAFEANTTADSPVNSILLEALDKPAVLVEIDHPDGSTVLKYSCNGPYNSLGSGFYSALLTHLSNIVREVSDVRSGTFANSEITATIDDTERYWRDLSESRYADNLEDSVVRVYLAAEEAAKEDWEIIYQGLLKSWEFKGSSVNLKIRFNDRQLIRKTPRGYAIASAGVLPNAPTESYGSVYPRVYGTFDSAVFTNEGLVPVLEIDVTGERRFLVAIGYVTVDRVYLDGVEQTSGYTITYENRSGTYMTILDWDADPGTAVISLDVTGYDSAADGTGTVWDNPVDQLRHDLNNFVFGEYRSGAWASVDSDFVDEESFTRLAAYYRAYVSARRFATSKNGAEILAEFCQSHTFHTYWTLDGKIAVGLLDIATAVPYSGHRLDIHTPDENVLDYSRSDRSKITRIALEYVFSDVENAYLFASDVAEPMRQDDQEAREDLKLRWGPDS